MCDGTSSLTSIRGTAHTLINHPVPAAVLYILSVAHSANDMGFVLRIWKPFAHKQPESPLFSYFDKYVFIVRIHPLCLMGISCVRCELFYSQVLYINYYYYNNNSGTVPHSTRSPLPTCFWLKAWAEPPSPQIEAPPRGRAWNISSSQ